MYCIIPKAFYRMPYQTFIYLLSFEIKLKLAFSLLLLLGIYPTTNWEMFSQSSFSETAQAIDVYFRRLEAYGLSGSLLIGNKDEILFKNDYGISPRTEGIDPAFLVGSISKQFTATAILVLEQKGLLSTEDYVSKYLFNIPADKSKITIHQLLTHTSGLQDDYWDQHKNLQEDEYIAFMLSKDFETTPGSRFSYVNFGYHLLAKVIESVSKKNYEQFLVEELFQPNGLYETGFSLVDWKTGQLAEYSDWTTEGSEEYIRNPLDRPIYLQPEGSGGILSTTADLYRWYQTIFHMEKVLTEASRNKLLTTEKENYGYAWEIYQTSRNTSLVEHGGYDSWVGVVTAMYNFVEENLIVIYLGNTHMSQLLIKEDLMNSIESFVFGGQVQMPFFAVPYRGKLDLSKYVGNYERNKKSISISEGKIDQQIRLRTTDQEVIRQFFFPHISDSSNTTDAQLTYIVQRINDGDYEVLEGMFYNELPPEAIKKRYGNIWAQLTNSLGKYQKLSVLHTVPGSYEGNFELQIFLELQFENASYYVRAFRNHNGRIHIQPFEFPDKMELSLTPVKENTFIYWNIKTGLSSTIEMNSNRLVINAKTDFEFVKK